MNLQVVVPRRRWFHALPVLRRLHEKDVLLARMTTTVLQQNATIGEYVVTIASLGNLLREHGITISEP
jgi:hypothetical protein